MLEWTKKTVNPDLFEYYNDSYFNLVFFFHLKNVFMVR